MQNKIEKIVPLEKVAENAWYEEMAELAVIFNHEIIENEDGTWRWKPNSLMNHIRENGSFYEGTDKTKMLRGSISLNNLWEDFHSGKFTPEEFMKFYMQIGYSLSGFYDVFGQIDAIEWKCFSDAKKRTSRDPKDQYVQTPIDYILEKYKGKTLKL